VNLAERLIVAADYSPKDYGGIAGVEAQVLALAEIFKGTGVYIKVNSIARAVDYGLTTRLHALGLKVMVDLKLNDIPKTMRTDAQLLAEVGPDIVTVMCSAGVAGMRAVQEVLGDQTEVLGVTVLTSLDEEACQAVFGCSPEAGVIRFAQMAKDAGISGLVLSPLEADAIIARPELDGLSLVTPGIRPKYAFVPGDDQKRKSTPMEAIASGVCRLVVGRPITQAAPNNDGLPQNPLEAAERILAEIQEGLDARGVA
jgi:orotidine-5'-phosphate decarboxylase